MNFPHALYIACLLSAPLMVILIYTPQLALWGHLSCSLSWFISHSPNHLGYLYMLMVACYSASIGILEINTWKWPVWLGNELNVWFILSEMDKRDCLKVWDKKSSGVRECFCLRVLADLTESLFLFSFLFLCISYIFYLFSLAPPSLSFFFLLWFLSFNTYIMFGSEWSI